MLCSMPDRSPSSRYMLEGDGVSCRICEKFVPNLFDLFDPCAEATDADGIEIAGLGGEAFKLLASPTGFIKGVRPPLPSLLPPPLPLPSSRGLGL